MTEQPTPDTGQPARQARRDALLHLTRRMLSGALLPSERDLLATHVEEALRDGDQAREQRDQAGASLTDLRNDLYRERGAHEEHRQQLANVLGEARGHNWPHLIGRAETIRAAATERADLLEEARDALEAAGQNGAHGDDWPAIAPAIRALGEQLAAARAGDAPWIKAYREDLTAAEERARKAERVANMLADAERYRQAAEATLTAVRKAVADALQHENPLGLTCQCGVDHLGAIDAALGDPQPATEPEVSAAACGPEAQWDAAAPEPECKDPQGCHRVVPCIPGCAVTSRALADAMAKTREQPAEPLADAVAELAEAYRAYQAQRHAALADAMRTLAAAFRTGGDQ